MFSFFSPDAQYRQYIRKYSRKKETGGRDFEFSRRIRTAEEERGLRTLSNFVFRVGEQFSWPRRSYRLHRRRTRHRRRCAQWVEYTVKRTSFMYNKLRLGIYVSSRLHLSATRPSSALLCVSLSLSFPPSPPRRRRRGRGRRKKEETSRDLVEETL